MIIQNPELFFKPKKAMNLPKLQKVAEVRECRLLRVLPQTFGEESMLLKTFNWKRSSWTPPIKSKTKHNTLKYGP